MLIIGCLSLNISQKRYLLSVEQKILATELSFQISPVHFTNTQNEESDQKRRQFCLKETS